MPIGNAARVAGMAYLARQNRENNPETVKVPEAPENSPSNEPTSGSNTLRNIATGAGLVYLSALATAADYAGKSQQLPEIPRLIATSSAHPSLGYLGAWAGELAFHKSSKKVKAAAAFVGATVANFVTEAAQSVLVASPEYANFLSSQNLPETAKDYAFSLLGAGLYMLQNRRENR